MSFERRERANATAALMICWSGGYCGLFGLGAAIGSSMLLQLAGQLFGLLDAGVKALLAHTLEVVALLEQRSQSHVGSGRVDRVASQYMEGFCPIQGLSYTWRAIEVEPAQVLDERAHLACELLADVRKPRTRNGNLALE